MERRSMSEIIQEFQPLIRKHEGDDGLVLTEAVEEAGTKMGDNYMSVVIRTTVSGKRGNGNAYQKSFMTKHFPKHREISALMGNQLFLNEAHVYNHILPVLGPFGAECLYADGDKIIMGDLKGSGFKISDRINLLDMDHTVAVLQKLADFHAKALDLKIKDPQKFQELVEPMVEGVFPKDSEQSLGSSIEFSVATGIEHLSSLVPQTKDIKDAIEFVRSFSGKGYSVMQELASPPPDKYHTMSHGDTWNNNVMFKYDANGKITDVKLLDYQILRHNSVAIDLLYFLYSSSQTPIIENHFDDVIKIYHNAFIQRLRDSDVSEEILQDLQMDWLKRELKKYAPYGLLTGMWLVNAVLAEDDDIINIDEMKLDDFQQETFKIQIKPRKAERIKSVVFHIMRTFR